MPRRCLAGTVMLGLVAVASAADPVETGNESALVNRLIAAVPVLSSDDESQESFELTGVMPSQAVFYPVRMEFSWHRGDQLSVLLRPMAEDVPIVWACQERVAIYDPTREELAVLKGEFPSIRLQATPRRLDVDLSMHSDPPAQQLIDLRSMFTSLGDDWEVKRTQTGWQISQPSRSGRTRITGTFSDDDEPAFLTLQVVTTDESQFCLFAVESLRINQPPCSRVRRLPDGLAELPHSESEVDSVLDLAAASRQTARAIIVNVGLHEKSVREHEGMPFLMMQNVDWDAARQQHARMLPRLEAMMQRHFSEVEQPSTEG